MFRFKRKGEYIYYPKEDNLKLKIKDKKENYSILLRSKFCKSEPGEGDIILNIDSEGFVIGISFLEASQIFKISKDSLEKIKKYEYQAKIIKKSISIKVEIEAEQNNKSITKKFSIKSKTREERETEVDCSMISYGLGF